MNAARCARSRRWGAVLGLATWTACADQPIEAEDGDTEQDLPCQVADIEESCWVTAPIYDGGTKAFCLCDGGVADWVQPMGATDYGQESGSWSRQWSCSGLEVQVEGSWPWDSTGEERTDFEYLAEQDALDSGREGDMEDPHGFFVRGDGGIAHCD